MKKLKKLFVLVAVALFPLTMSAQDENFYIFLCIGQSNMAGKGEIEAIDRAVPDNFLSLSAVNGKGRKLGQWRKAVPPNSRDDAGLSVVDYFGRTMIDNLPEGARVGIIQVAVDGAGIDLFDKTNYRRYISTVTESWKKKQIDQLGGNPYARLIELARKAQDEGDIRGIIIHQGETDAYDKQWIAKVKKIYNDIIHDLDLDIRTPLVVGEVGGADQAGQCARANIIINQLPKGFQQCHVASSKGCSLQSDRLHFDSDGYRTLGRRFGMKMLQALGFEFHDYKSEVVAAPYQPTIDVNASIDTQGLIMAQATEPLRRIDILNKSGYILKTMHCDGTRNVVINTREFPAESYLKMIFLGMNGATVELEMTP